MRTPFLLVNFKAYPEALGPKAVELAKACAKVAEETGISLGVAPSALDLALVAKSVRLPVFAQHLDPVETGKATGWIPPEAALPAGAVGTIVNHSERKVAWEEMRDLIARCRELGLEVVVCADDVAEAETAAKLGPDYIAVEPPELIGGDVSVTSAKPEVITRAVERIRTTNPKVHVLCGAGVKTGRDVAKALELGTVGILLASGVVKAKSPEKALRDLAKGLVREA
ncbi:MAG: triose-phosphate isomerase [Euryarchaeota archaeon]|nr:triose-phosphate isomerase [Euryarchaeota archaeon]